MSFRFKFGLRWEYKPVGEAPTRRGQEVIFDQLFTRFKEGVGDFTPAFRLIAEDILEPVVQDIFKQEKADVTWQELAASTIAQRGSAHPILRRTGMLQESFEKGQPGHHEEIEPRLLRWGSDVPYALFHQKGTGKGFDQDRVATGPGTGRGMARRREIYLSDRMKHMMANTMVGRMAQVARMIGFRVLGSRGVSPLEARMAGEQILGERGFAI